MQGTNSSNGGARNTAESARNVEQAHVNPSPIIPLLCLGSFFMGTALPCVLWDKPCPVKPSHRAYDCILQVLMTVSPPWPCIHSIAQWQQTIIVGNCVPHYMRPKGGAAETVTQTAILLLSQ